ncbi:MAG TPA: cobalt ABC transporter substrate-binding protein, partial [Telluria sp.]
MKKLLLSLLVLSAPVAQAHHIWLEQDGKTVRLQFGEFTLNQRETTPGLLDKFVAPTATLLGAA